MLSPALSPRWHKVTRDLSLHKARTGIAVAAISVGIIGAGSVLNAWSLVRRATRSELEESRPPSAVVKVDSVDAVLLARIRAMPEIESVSSRQSTSATVVTASGPRTALLIASDDFVANQIGVIKREGGTWPPDTSGVVIERSSVEFSGIALGDEVTLRIGNGNSRPVRITGIARDVGVAPGWMEHIVYLFVSPAVLTRLGGPASLNELHILVRNHELDRPAIRLVASRVRRVAEQSGHEVHGVSVPVPGRHIHAGQIDSLLLTQGAFGLLALLLSGVLVVNLIAAMLTGQVREIGVMKALGADSRQIAGMYLAFALLLGLAASVISVPVAAVLGRLYAKFTAQLLNFDVSQFSIPLWSYLLQAAVGIVLPLAAAAIPITRGCRISVSDALRDAGITDTASRSPGRLLAGLSGLSRPLVLSLRNAFRGRGRMLLTLSTLAIGGAVYLGSLNLRSAIRDSVDVVFASQQFDMTFRFAEAHAEDSLITAALQIPGVAKAEAWDGASASRILADSSAGDGFPLMAPPLSTKMIAVEILAGRWLQVGSVNELVVGRRLVAEDSTLVVGSTIALKTRGKVSVWTVVGVANTGIASVAYVSREALQRVLGTSGAGGLVVRSNERDNAAQLALIRRIRNELTERGFDISSAQSMPQQRAVVEDHLLMVGGFLGNMSLLMLVVGGLALASTMSLSVLERTREIGVMRAIGASHRDILAIVQIEGLVIAVLSWIVAIPLSLPMSIFLEKAFSRVMMEVPVHVVPEPLGIMSWFLLVVVISLVACAWPAIRATRITTAAALAY